MSRWCSSTCTSARDSSRRTSDRARARIAAIDAARGAVMIVMALDHVRDFIHREAMVSSPTDLQQTTVALFLVHAGSAFCARRYFTPAWACILVAARPVATRAGWVTGQSRPVVRAARTDRDASRQQLLAVLGVSGAADRPLVIGASMVASPPVCGCHVRFAGLAVAVIALHNLLDPCGRAARISGAAVELLHARSRDPAGGDTFIVAYPLMPWVAVMALGLASGPVFEQDAAARQRILLLAGIAATLGFVLLRANGYGDPAPWSSQPTAAFTVLSFLNTTKYPPSLAFLLMTLGPALVGLAWLDRSGVRSSHPLVVYGRAPLFYFVAHFFLAHLALGRTGARPVLIAAWAFIGEPVPSMGGPRASYPPDFGYDLWVAYVVWIAVVLAPYRLPRRWRVESAQLTMVGELPVSQSPCAR